MTTTDKLWHHLKTLKDVPEDYQVELYVSKPDVLQDARVLTVKDFKKICYDLLRISDV